MSAEACSKAKKANALMLLSNAFTHDPRVYNEAESLVGAGYSVTVLAWDKKAEAPAEETKEGIKVIRMRNNWLMRLLPYDFMRMHVWWRIAYKKAKELNIKEKFDFIHCHDLDTLPIGVRLKEKFDVPLIYDAHEIWGYMVSRYLPKILADHYLRLEKRLAKYPDSILTVNEPLKEYLAKITDRPIHIIMNCKPLQGNTYEPTKNKKLVLLYLGTLTPSRFLLELVDAVKEITDVDCIIGGSGHANYTEALKAKCKGQPNVKFVGRIPFNDVIPMTKKADVVVCMADPAALNNSRGLTNKQFEAMVCGRPVICTKGTYPGDFTEGEGVGLVAEYNKGALKTAIIRLRDNQQLRESIGRNALRRAIEEYNWERQEKVLVDLYEKIKR